MGVQHSSWFGSSDAPLLAHIHVPDDGRSRGAVVLCPPLGKEHLDTYRGIKALAEDLADRGLTSVRFDYAGVGDSSGDQDSPDAVQAWRRSVVGAVDLARTTGSDHITVVGLRAGALLAATALPECGPVDAVVLWDPILSGRGALREQRALYRVTQGADDPSDPRVSIIGGVLAPEAAADLGALKIEAGALAGARTLLATRSAARDTPAVSALADAIGGDELALSGHDAFVTPSALYAEIPFTSVREIADWISGGAPADAHQVVTTLRRRAVVATTTDGSPVYESVESLGPNSLFALRTQAAETVGNDGRQPTVLFFGTAYEHRIGPSRLWVELARTLASHGISSVRFDRSGVGDTGAVGHGQPASLYSEVSDRDALDAAEALGVDPDDIVVTGLCSGAWYASYVALASRARAVVLVNMILWSTHRRKSLREQLRPPVPAAPGGGDAGAEPAPLSLRARIKPFAREHLPYRVWLLLGRLGVTQVPEVILEALRRAGVDVTVVLSAQDHRSFRYQRGEEGLRRVQRRGFTGRVRTGATGDHGAYQRDGREFLRTEITAAVLSRFGRTAAARESVADADVS
ncbi:alpha/beta fold hydrolase [Rhodococcus coprophilus]|uniref:Exosortase A system-associated hydrolase 2 n=1 Tax=Rhodococcus coprophilus TaxID=38310 RepID=A0A2X4UAQ5_9NOCA|nr:alpha/beta fold hydrolase [Rhodococcus coprophilus]MBM7459417.1 alpha-beta hydrolase superfamily lysophospholipase [Rhodococcus coprophilus]SQI36001.1 exosortase A system-associated hydrolase 2 [Rhodococcus coprophilus]